MLIAGVAAAAVLAGCGFNDRRGAADSIGATIRSMPGVATSDVSYDTSFDGGAHFSLAVTLAPTVTTEQAAAVARTYVDRMIAADFKGFDVVLGMVFRSSKLTTRYDFLYKVEANPTAQAVADGVSWWLDVARSPNIDAVQVSLPLEDTSHAAIGPNVTVDLPVGADDAALRDLIRAHPQLNSARWVISIAAKTPAVQPDTYQSDGQLPDRRARETWLRITQQLTNTDSASASTRLPRQQTTTEVTVRLGYDHGGAGDFERIARTVTELLSGLPLPALLQLNARDRNLAVTVGGCTSTEPKYNHPAEPLEAELRHQYERC